MKRVTIFIFLCFISGIGIFNLIAKDQSFSEQENRMLSQFPTLTFERVISGEFTRDFEKYFRDQFVWKSFWTGMKADIESITMKQENNGVFFGSDGYLFDKFDEPGDSIQSNINSIQYFINKTTNMTSYVLVAPTSIDIYPEKLPMFAKSYSQQEIISDMKSQLTGSVKVIDVYDDLLSNKEEAIYFRTDHHWTMRGAYYAYRRTAKDMGLDPYKLEDFKIEQVSNNFYGSLYSKANTRRIKPDIIEVFQSKDQIMYNVQYEDNRRTTNLFEWDNLNKKDQYTLFLDGNHSLVKIKTSINNGRKLAVIKDSYAHAFIPFLANHFEEIHIIDLRYYHLNVYNYLEDNRIKETLFLYNIPNFTKDSNIVWLKQ